MISLCHQPLLAVGSGCRLRHSLMDPSPSMNLVKILDRRPARRLRLVLDPNVFIYLYYIYAPIDILHTEMAKAYLETGKQLGRFSTFFLSKYSQILTNFLERSE
jgi:hypothetical protein